MPEDLLIYDLGLHRGEDTDFYLRKGFRVVGVDANAELCDHVDRINKAHVLSGRLTVINKAISDSAGTEIFYQNNVLSEWGTIDPKWAKRNERTGAFSKQVIVESTTFLDLLEMYGPAHYIKIDIEGMDRVALQSLQQTVHRPKFISIESDKVSLENIRAELELLLSLGYDKFKIVPQHKVDLQRVPSPAREGNYTPYQFKRGQTGLFGDELPGQWKSADQAMKIYKWIFLRYILVGDDPLITHPVVRKVLDNLGLENGWYDTHARRSDF